MRAAATRIVQAKKVSKVVVGKAEASYVDDGIKPPTEKAPESST